MEHRRAQRRTWAWIIVGLSTVGLILFAYWQQFIFNPLLLSLLIAYILNPLVVLLERWFSRAAAVTMIFLSITGSCVVGVFLLSTVTLSEMHNFYVILLGESELKLEPTSEKHAFWPMLKPEEELHLIEKRKQGLIETTRGWCLKQAVTINNEYHFMDKTSLTEAFQWSGVRDWVQKHGDEIKQHGLSVLSGTMAALWSGAERFLGLLLYLILVPIFTFFFMLNLHTLRDIIFNHLPHAQRDKIIQILDQIHIAVSAFFRGRLMIALILAALAMPLLILCKVAPSHAALLSLIFGTVIVLPYVWLLTNVLPTIIILNWTVAEPLLPILTSCVVYFALSCLEMFVLTPLILGKSVHLHPVLLMMSIFLFGSLFGLFGVLMAVPLACIVKILFEGYVLPRLKLLAAPPDPEQPTTTG